DLIKAGRFQDANKAIELLLEVQPDNRAALEQRLETARALGSAEEVAGLSEKLGSAFGETPADTIVRDIEPAPEFAPPRPSGIERALTREEKDFLSEHLT